MSNGQTKMSIAHFKCPIFQWTIKLKCPIVQWTNWNAQSSRGGATEGVWGGGGVEHSPTRQQIGKLLSQSAKLDWLKITKGTQQSDICLFYLINMIVHLLVFWSFYMHIFMWFPALIFIYSYKIQRAIRWQIEANSKLFSSVFPL